MILRHHYLNIFYTTHAFIFFQFLTLIDLELETKIDIISFEKKTKKFSSPSQNPRPNSLISLLIIIIFYLRTQRRWRQRLSLIS